MDFRTCLQFLHFATTTFKFNNPLELPTQAKLRSAVFCNQVFQLPTLAILRFSQARAPFVFMTVANFYLRTLNHFYHFPALDFRTCLKLLQFATTGLNGFQDLITRLSFLYPSKFKIAGISQLFQLPTLAILWILQIYAPFVFKTVANLLSNFELFLRILQIFL